MRERVLIWGNWNCGLLDSSHQTVGRERTGGSAVPPSPSWAAAPGPPPEGAPPRASPRPAGPGCRAGRFRGRLGPDRGWVRRGASGGRQQGRVKGPEDQRGPVCFSHCFQGQFAMWFPQPIPGLRGTELVF